MQKVRSQGKNGQNPKNGLWVGRSNSDKTFGAIFQDDGKNGSFYLCALDSQEILGCVEIYQTPDLPYSMREEYIQIHWAEHGQRVALCVRGWPIAGFDIPNLKGWMVEEVPPEDANETDREAALIDALVAD